MNEKANAFAKHAIEENHQFDFNYMNVIKQNQDDRKTNLLGNKYYM